ncbi:MAG: non-ribosomal peptide synthetase, partial [Paracoccus sp. (in: a-proteobacteria)]|nr:non-ribosomal peptide synthetase [Paracoccus sp. (in: a-proteobacteria)]
ALLSGRGIGMVAGQFGVLAAGAAFLPMDPDAPEAHQRRILDEAGVRLILAAPEALARAHLIAGPDRRVIALPEAPASHPAAPGQVPALAGLARPGPEDPAYVIYTSGSTGRPKGVLVPHRGVCRLVRGQDYADLGPDLVMLSMAAVSFDAIVIEVFSPLLNGGRLVLLPDTAPSLDRIGAVIREGGVTQAYITAGLFHLIAEHQPEVLAPLRMACPCGDVLSAPHILKLRALYPHLRLLNSYGPAENSVMTCAYEIGPEWQGGPIPIGRGINHDRIFVLDDDHAPLPAGRIGQLAVGGAGLALGYLNRPDLTDAAFIPLRAGDFDGRVYLTGDLVERRADGLIHFHGRADRQIKINGQRVELDGVEHALRALPELADAAAIAAPRADGTKHILAFARPARGGISADDLLARLRGVLPAAAIPARLILRDELPLSPSGKVDRKRLAAEHETPAAPASGTTGGPGALIRAIWAEVLGHSALPEGRSFFDCGGTSLQLIAVHAKLQQELGRRFDIALLFQAPRIDDLAALLASDPADTPDPLAAQRARMMQARTSRARSR